MQKKSGCYFNDRSNGDGYDPQLNSRYNEEIIAKTLYILDSQLKLPQHARVS